MKARYPRHFLVSATRQFAPRSWILISGLFLCLALSVYGGTPPWWRDKLPQVVNAAAVALAKGEAREIIISNLVAAVAVEPKSTLVPIVQTLIDDLQRTLEQAKRLSFQPEDIRQHPERYLMESKVNTLDLVYHQSGFGSGEHLRKAYPDDPAALLLAQGRSSIEKIIACLEDSSVARTTTGLRIMGGELPRFMRAREIAMAILEMITGCDFLAPESFIFGRTPKNYSSTIEHIREWWSRNKARSREEGIRDELDWAYPRKEVRDNQRSGLIWMARNLAESDQPTFAAHGEKVLEDMVATQRCMDAAQTLWRLGSHRPLELLRARYTDAQSEPVRVNRRAGPPTIFTLAELNFLMRFGGREEWEILKTLAETEVEAYGQIPRKEDSSGNPVGVLPGLLEDRNGALLWVVPCLALALGQTNVYEADHFFAADAVEELERLTGENFGFQREGSIASRRQAAERAKAWWEKEGQSTYTFERIAVLWHKMSPTKPVKRTPRIGPPPLYFQIVPDGWYAFDWQLQPKDSAADKTHFVIQVTNGNATCMKCSDPNFVGTKGTFQSKDPGSFWFNFALGGDEGVPPEWFVRIDGGFLCPTKKGTMVVTPVKPE